MCVCVCMCMCVCVCVCVCGGNRELPKFVNSMKMNFLPHNFCIIVLPKIAIQRYV